MANRSQDYFNKEIGDKVTLDVLPLFKRLIEAHIYEVREKAWRYKEYPCIGQFRFLNLRIHCFNEYSQILERLKGGHDTFLDLGCCFGHEVRKLVADGVPSENTYASDILPEFWDLGYDLFNDKNELKTKFIGTDIFSPSLELNLLDGRIDIIYAGLFLHLFDLRDQITACKKIIQLLKAKEGSMLLGIQVGNKVEGERLHITGKDGKMYLHSEQSFKTLWKEIGRTTGTEWDVRTEALPHTHGEDSMAMGTVWDDQMIFLRFSVVRK